MTTFIAKPSIARKRAYGGGMLKGALSPIQVNQRNPFGTVNPYLQGAQKLALAIMAGRENRQAANIEAEQAANKAAFTQSILGGLSIPPNVVNPRPTGPISGRLASLGDFLLGEKIDRSQAYKKLTEGLGGGVMPRALAGTFAHGAGVDPLQAAKIQAELAPDIPDPDKWTQIEIKNRPALFNETTKETYQSAKRPDGSYGWYNFVTGKWLDPIAADRAVETAGDSSTETPEPPMLAADVEKREEFIEGLPQLQASTARTINRFSANIKEATTLLEALRANPNLYGGDKMVNIFLTYWPGSTQKDIQEKLKKLKSNLGLDELKAMRDASKSGASGLGALSERELSVLESIDANLSGMQSQQQLMGELERLVTIWTQGAGRARKIYNNDFLRLDITSADFNEQQLKYYPNLIDLFRIAPEAEVEVRPAFNPDFENLIDRTPLGPNDQARSLLRTE